MRNCSFCGGEGHNITFCQSSYIQILYDNMEELYSNAYYYHNDRSKIYFKTEMIKRYQLPELRVISVKYLHAYTSNKKYEYVNMLWAHFVEQRINSYYDETDAIHTFVERRRRIQQPPPPIQQPPLQKKYNIYIILDLVRDNILKKTECAICYGNINYENKVKMNCNHNFCGVCIKQTFVYCKTLSPVCALCREPIKQILLQNKNTYDLIKQYCKYRCYTKRYLNSTA